MQKKVVRETELLMLFPHRLQLLLPRAPRPVKDEVVENLVHAAMGGVRGEAGEVLKLLLPGIVFDGELLVEIDFDLSHWYRYCPFRDALARSVIVLAGGGAERAFKGQFFF